MARSRLKRILLDQNLLYTTGTRKTYMRSSTITPAMIGTQVLIHNGVDFRKISIRADMVGHRLGEFSWTRKTNKFLHRD